jgi:hypothetical protein
MLATWVIEEMKDVNLEDKRLNSRLGVILDQLGGHPTASIPAACGGYAETMAAYRFFDNDKAGFESILQSHIGATWRRIAQQAVVILAQDTTEVDFTRPEQQMVGAGPLDGDSRRGALVHPMMGFTPDGTPLGTVYAEAWVRGDESPTPKSQRENKRKHTPIEEKESVRWVDALRHVRDLAEDVPQTQLVSVADSEADIYELFEESRGGPENLNWIVRACQNRALKKDEKYAKTAVNHLRERVLEEDVLFTHMITVRGRKAKVGCETRGRRQPRKSRQAQMEVRAARVTLRAPWRHDRKLADISINVVLVREVDPPAGDTPVEWILLTSLPIDDIEQVLAVIQYYCVRWMIEVFFRVLKSGCRVEERRFEHIDRALSCLAVYLIVTWRTLYVCRLGREFPEISCEAIFEPAEWKSVYYVVHKRPPPTTPPTLREMVRMVAQLGGYIDRKRTDEPGPQTVWLGLQRTHDIANCWLTFGPESKNEKILV